MQSYCRHYPLDENNHYSNIMELLLNYYCRPIIHHFRRLYHR